MEFDIVVAKRVLTKICTMLRYYKGTMNIVNVFPAKDKDTGTNLVETFESILAKVMALPDDATMYQFFETLRACGRYAKGNSGNIFFAFIRGFSDFVCPNHEELVRDFMNQQNISEELARESLGKAGYFDSKNTIGLDDFYCGIQAGANAAFDSVDVPREGTVLTVTRVVASVPKGDTIESTLKAMFLAAWVAVENTMSVEPFKSNHVIDGAAAGYALLLEATHKGLVKDDSYESCHHLALESLRPVATLDEDAHEYDSAYRYCNGITMSITEKSNLEKLRSTLRAFGDCLSVNPTKVGEYRLHVHVDDEDRLVKEIKKHGFIIIEMDQPTDMYAQKEERRRDLIKRNAGEEKIMVVTDNGSDLPLSDEQAKLDVLGITVRPDGTTAAVSAQEWYEYGESWMCNGIDVIFITLSSKLSSTFANAQNASARLALNYPNARVACIDSLCGSRGQAFLAETAMQMVYDGFEFDDIVKWVEETRHHAHIFFVLGKTDELKGRVPELAGKALDRLGLVPLVYLTPDGALKLWGFVREKNIVSALARRVKAVCRPLDKSVAVATLHTESSLPLAKELGAAITSMLGLVEPYAVGKVIGAYLPDDKNTVGVVVVGKPRR